MADQHPALALATKLENTNRLMYGGGNPDLNEAVAMLKMLGGVPLPPAGPNLADAAAFARKSRMVSPMPSSYARGFNEALELVLQWIEPRIPMQKGAA